MANPKTKPAGSNGKPSGDVSKDVDASMAEQKKLAEEGRKAALFAAQQKLLNDLADAVNSFIKNIGSSVKAAAQ